MDNITSIDELIGREAALAAQQLGNGLTALRKYNFSHKGYFYTGIFSVTIGLERVLKLILLFDYYLSHNRYPNNGYLKSKGHKLDDLINEAININMSRQLNIDVKIFDDNIIKKIINHLTDFAIKSRYYNLDAATGNIQTGNEPLARWDIEICSMLIDRHSRDTKKKREIMNFEQYMSNSRVHHTHENGSHIGDIQSYLTSCAYIEDKQSYSVLYLYKIIRFTVNLLKELEGHSLWEYFVLFRDNNNCRIRRKKNWDPYKL